MKTLIGKIIFGITLGILFSVLGAWLISVGHGMIIGVFVITSIAMGWVEEVFADLRMDEIEKRIKILENNKLGKDDDRVEREELVTLK